MPKSFGICCACYNTTSFLADHLKNKKYHSFLQHNINTHFWSSFLCSMMSWFGISSKKYHTYFCYLAFIEKHFLRYYWNYSCWRQIFFFHFCTNLFLEFFFCVAKIRIPYFQTLHTPVRIIFSWRKNRHILLWNSTYL